MADPEAADPPETAAAAEDMLQNHNLDISESMVHIDIGFWPKHLMRCAGIIMDYDQHSAYIIADARPFQNGILLQDSRISITFSSLSGVKLDCEKYHVENGLIGFLCFSKLQEDRMNTIKKIKICVRPLKMCEAVYVYEGVKGRLTSGNVTRLSGRHFSHDCAVCTLAEFGAPVINKDGEFVGINCSAQYQLNARTISKLLGTIANIWDEVTNIWYR